MTSEWWSLGLSPVDWPESQCFYSSAVLLITCVIKHISLETVGIYMGAHSLAEVMGAQ